MEKSLKIITYYGYLSANFYKHCNLTNFHQFFIYTQGSSTYPTAESSIDVAWNLRFKFKIILELGRPSIEIKEV